MDKASVKAYVDRIRAKVAENGGWDGPWASRRGLKESQVGQWVSRGRIPRAWLLALKPSLGPFKAV